MKVKVRTFGDETSRVIFNNITTIQTGPGGTIVWVSADTFEADITLTIESDNHAVQNRENLWVRGPND